MWPVYSNTRVLGLGHKARQGKDLVAKLLAKRYPGKVQRFSFADALRGYARAIHGMTHKDAALLQDIGVNVRNEDQDAWVRAVAWAIGEWDAEATGPQVAVVTDVRFKNEAAWVRETGGGLCRVQRVLPDGSIYVAADRPATHISETDLDDFPWPQTIAAKHGDLGYLAGCAVNLVHDTLGAPKAKMPVVYISGKFRGRNTWAIEQHVRAAEKLALDVWMIGGAALCPHLNTRFFQDTAPDHVWLDGDLVMVERSDALLTVDNWTDSEGAKAEVEVAHDLKIPVFHSLRDLQRWMGEQGY